MRTPEQYAARAAAAWHPPPSPACVADIEGAVREALLDAAALAQNVYGDAVAALGNDEPFVVGDKIAGALRRAAGGG